MNFLSHFHFYRNGNPYYDTGLVLPDLVRNICKTHLKPKAQYTDIVKQNLGSGSLAHIEGDRIFHQSDFFKVCESYIGSRLNAEAQWPRKWFLNHLLLEIALDRVLMERDPQLCIDFYHQLGLCDGEKIQSFLQDSECENHIVFAAGYQRFVSFPFIFDYVHNEKIIFALSRVYLRTGINYEWTGTDRELLLQQLPGILEFIGTKIAGLKVELK